MFKRCFLDNTLFRNSILCASISQKQNQLPKRSKVRCKEEEERIQFICKTQNRDLPPSGPFSQILSHTNTVSVNYFLSVCAGCEVSQSCVETILNKLPNLTALNFDRIEIGILANEVNVHNVQMQCIHVCAVTQPVQHAVCT